MDITKNNPLVLSDQVRKTLSKVSPDLPIIFILFLAFLIRLHGVESMSLSNDEMSSLWRSFMHPSWHDMMAVGVMTDGHPPLTYIIMRIWLTIFGDSVLSIRLPFIIAGVAGLYYMYRTGVLWFGRTAALLSISLFAMMSYSIYYHQIARPYSFGFLWVQAAAYYWTQFLWGDKPGKKNIQLALWGLMAVCSCYTHYFSMMAVGLMGLTGLFFINRSNYRSYLLSGVAIGLFLLPGVRIFKQQLSYNGLGWLPPPGRNWLIEYFASTLNNSTLIYVFLALFFVASIIVGAFRHTLRFNKFQLIGISWFLISFLIGYFKSIYSKPVLQTSCLFFTYPFLVLAFFSFWRDEYILTPTPLQRRGANEPLKPPFWGLGVVGVFILLLVGFYDTVYRDRYYSTEHHGEFKGLAVQMAVWTDNYGPDLLRMANVNNKYYIDYYWVKMMHRSEKIALYSVDSDEDIRRMDSLLSVSKEAYFAYAWSTKSTPDTVFRIIERHYPHLIADPPHFNSGIRLYSK